MRAVVHAGAGGPDVLAIREIDDPSPGPRQVRVRVRASALNRADILQRQGRYHAPPGWPAEVPGLEYAGEIESAGAGSRWAAGDRVMGIAGGGAHAELLVVPEDEVLPIPAALDFGEAAAVPEAFLTAFDALTVRGRLKRGERVLIHTVGSGVGTAAAQLAHAMGSTVLGTLHSRATGTATIELNREGRSLIADWINHHERAKSASVLSNAPTFGFKSALALRTLQRLCRQASLAVFRGGLKNGVATTLAPTKWRVPSTVISISSCVPVA